ncbi:hypothetical protein EDEG_00982 [Edhazardia aedis USNM 41457]|uniref:CDP-diacylglycerol--inositol 3-phosphatidyltransferase n=1 Tax=Edhazardia aedis (strain USNM 41457) TaxID=1003232 RepID=J9DU36_EDHAE|nr:hypothetical protein EDEG_00982 [Edhazardia aedis USNM 41457]|eukprot:EJW04812.1 hypothetical protein EDEG_00982 [Edhazardia aedis USNM 41457]
MKVDIIFNKPNTVGLLRILLLILGIFSEKYVFLALYTVSASLDALDGKLARKYNECTVLGSCLDMITDRSSTILIITKIVENAAYSKNFRLYFTKRTWQGFSKFLSTVLIVDILSHFMYFSFALINKQQHKTPKNWLLSLYYNKNILLFLCTTVEIFYVFLYFLIAFDVRIIGLYKNLLYFLVICCIVKSFFHIVQLYVALDGLSYVENPTMKIK